MRRNKYNAKKVAEDGYLFDSKREHAYYRQLKLLEKAGKICRLKVHPVFDIVINSRRVCRVELDFEYRDNEDEEDKYVDVKGVYTALSRLKHKLVEAYCAIRVDIVK